MLRLRIILSAILVTLGIGVGSAAESAASVIDKTAKKIHSAPSLAATFSAAQGQESVSGALTMAGDKFHLKVPGLETWFDGLTQWTYSDQTDEVNITAPTRQEVMETNPLAIVGELKKAYSLRLLASPKGKYKVELTPKSKATAAFSRAIVTIDASTWLPSEINLTGVDGRATVVRVSSIKVGKALPAATFKFNPKKYPGAEIVDLR